MARHFVKLYADILRSSVWAESATTRLLWITMLADADEQGFVRGDVHALARLANLTTAEVEAGLSVLTAPDPASHTTDNDGRRVVAVAPGMWLLVNYLAYREMRTGKQAAEAERKARYRERRRGTCPADMSHMSREVSTSTSTSVPSLTQQQPIPEKELVGREGDPLTAVLAEAKLDLAGFEATDRAVIEGMLRSSKSPLARAVVLANALKEYHPAVVGRAFREFIASEQPWSTRLFGGFVRDAEKQLVRVDNRHRAKRETAHIDREAIDAEKAKREEADVRERLNEWERTTEQGERDRLTSQAEGMVDRRVRGTFRDAMVRAALVTLIGKRGANGTR